MKEDMHVPFKYCDFQCIDDARHDSNTELVAGRVREIVKRKQKGYPLGDFKTDVAHCNSKVSEYTEALAARLNKTIDETVSLSNSEKAELTGVPLEQIKKVYDKGVAAHRTGHRVGASPQAWGKARVNSFLQNGCTNFATDHKQLQAALETMQENKQEEHIREWMSQPVMCSNLHKPWYQKRLEKLNFYKKKLCEYGKQMCPKSTTNVF